MSAGRDWADTEDHDFLNDFVGQRIDRIETGTTDGSPWLAVHTNRGRALTIAVDVDAIVRQMSPDAYDPAAVAACALTISEEP